MIISVSSGRNLEYERGPMDYDIYIQKKNRLYIAEVPALPGCHTVGRSEGEVLENIRDIIEGYSKILEKKRMPFSQVKIVRIKKDAVVTPGLRETKPSRGWGIFRRFFGMEGA